MGLPRAWHRTRPGKGGGERSSGVPTATASLLCACDDSKHWRMLARSLRLPQCVRVCRVKYCILNPFRVTARAAESAHAALASLAVFYTFPTVCPPPQTFPTLFPPPPPCANTSSRLFFKPDKPRASTPARARRGAHTHDTAHATDTRSRTEKPETLTRTERLRCLRRPHARHALGLGTLGGDDSPRSHLAPH